MSALSVFVLGLLNSFCFFPYPHVHDERVESFLKKKKWIFRYFIFSLLVSFFPFLGERYIIVRSDMNRVKTDNMHTPTNRVYLADRISFLPSSLMDSGGSNEEEKTTRNLWFV
jgi:hypothetical protein